MEKVSVDPLAEPRASYGNCWGQKGLLRVVDSFGETPPRHANARRILAYCVLPATGTKNLRVALSSVPQYAGVAAETVPKVGVRTDRKQLSSVQWE